MQASELRPGQFFEYEGRRCMWAGVERGGCTFWNYVCFEDGCMVLDYETQNFEVTPLNVTGWDDESTPAPLQLREGAWYRDGNQHVYQVASVPVSDGDPYCFKAKGVIRWYTKSGLSCTRIPSDDLIAEVPPPVEPLDVGEGWRLLGKDEPVEEGDEYLDTDGVWYRSVHFHHASRTQAAFPYRRKIKAQEPQSDADGWIEHDGSRLKPTGLDDGVSIDCKYDDGSIGFNRVPSFVSWKWITHYRLVPSPQPAPIITDWVEVVTR